MASNNNQMNSDLEKLIRESPIIADMRYIQCPYNSVHNILQERFQNHLIRCRKQFKDVPKMVCPFNATHILNKPEMPWHLQSCVDRLVYEHLNYPTVSNTDDNIPKYEGINTIPVWDYEPITQSYNPQEYCLNAPVYRTIQGESPAIKKKFRQDEIKRMRTIKTKLEEESKMIE